MRSTPIFATEYALVRYLKAFARKLGMSEIMAEATAQVQLQTDKGLFHWSQFLVENCSVCKLDPGTCPYLNPGPIPGRSADDVRAGIAMSIEMARILSCPDKQS